MVVLFACGASWSAKAQGPATPPATTSVTTGQDQACAAKAAYIYALLVERPRSYQDLVTSLPPEEGGVSLAAMYAALNAVHPAVAVGAVSIDTLRSARRPVVLLYPGTSRAVDGVGGGERSVGHFVVVLPIGDQAVMLDASLGRAERLGWSQIWLRAGLGPSDKMVVLSDELRLGGETAQLGAYEAPSPTVEPHASVLRSIDLGVVLAPATGETTVVDLDAGAYAVGDEVHFTLRLEGEDAPFRVERGTSTCACAAMAVVDAGEGPFRSATLFGRVQIRPQLASGEVEQTSVRLVRGAGEGVVAVRVGGTPKIRAEVWPSVLSLGLLPVGREGTGHARVRLDRPRRLSVRDAGVVAAELTRGGDTSDWELRVRLGRGEDGGRTLVVLHDPDHPEYEIEVPVTWQRCDVLACDPSVMEVEGDGWRACVRFADGRRIVRAESSGWLSTEIEIDGSVSVRVREGTLRQRGEVRRHAEDGGTARAVVLRRLISRNDP